MMIEISIAYASIMAFSGESSYGPPEENPEAP